MFETTFSFLIKSVMERTKQGKYSFIWICLYNFSRWGLSGDLAWKVFFKDICIVSQNKELFYFNFLKS